MDTAYSFPMKHLHNRSCVEYPFSGFCWARLFSPHINVLLGESEHLVLGTLSGEAKKSNIAQFLLNRFTQLDCASQCEDWIGHWPSSLTLESAAPPLPFHDTTSLFQTVPNTKMAVRSVQVGYYEPYLALLLGHGL